MEDVVDAGIVNFFVKIGIMSESRNSCSSSALCNYQLADTSKIVCLRILDHLFENSGQE